MNGIGWLIIIVVSICTLSAIYYFNRRGKKLGSVKRDILYENKKADTQATRDECVKPPATEYPGEEEADTRQSFKGKNVPRKVTSRCYYAEERTKSPVRHDYNKRFEDSIITPIPADYFGPASPFLHEAWQLEREGGDQKAIERLLHKAREADPEPTDQYRTRLFIMKQGGWGKDRYGS